MFHSCYYASAGKSILAEDLLGDRRGKRTSLVQHGSTWKPSGNTESSQKKSPLRLVLNWKQSHIRYIMLSLVYLTKAIEELF